MQNYLQNKFCALKNNLTFKMFTKKLPYIAFLAVVTFCICVMMLSLTKTVNIHDGTGNYSVKIFSGGIDKAMKLAGLGGDDYSVLDLSNKNGVTDVTVRRTFPVYIVSGNTKTEVRTSAGTVGQILKAAGFKIDEYDIIEPAIDTNVNKSTKINYTDISFVVGNYTEEIPCETKTIYSDSVKVGTTTIKNGVNGLKQVSYTAKLVNGVECQKDVISEQVISPAVTAIKTVGTGASSVADYSTYTYSGCLTKSGGVYLNPYTGYKETWYSQKVLPGNGLSIPGRHVDAEGFICDGDGYICIASSELPKGTIVPISRGVGKVYDSGCAKGVIDVYVNW